MPSPTSSSPATSPDRPAEVVLADYRLDDDAEAQALERRCPQGQGIRLSFRRDAFHQRAQGYPVHRLLTARAGGMLVGVVAAAIKDAELLGRPVKAGFGFDLRVDPAWRGRGVGKRLFEAASAWCLGEAEVCYSYTVADNTPARRLVGRYGEDVGGYAYLVCPVHRLAAGSPPASAAAPEEVHAELRRLAGPFDLSFDPFAGGRPAGLAGSWVLRRGAERAGCSAWSTRGVLSEVVEAVPWWLALIRSAQGAFPALARRLPRVPAPGEELRSWYLFDFFATGSEIARALVRSVLAEAQGRAIEWCHLVHDPSGPWAAAVRADLPRFFSPVVPYRLLMLRRDGARPSPLRRLLVDPRDL